MARGVPGKEGMGKVGEPPGSGGKKLAVGSLANEENWYLAHEILKEVHRLTKEAPPGKEYYARNMNSVLNSIKKHPLPIESGEKAKQLEGVGKVIARQIDDILARRGKNNPPPPSAPAAAAAPQQQPVDQTPPKVHVVAAEDVRVEHEEGGEAAPKAKRARTSHAVGIKELVEAGRLKAGQRVKLRKQDKARGRDVEEEGVVTQEGTITHRGTAYKTPNAFANAAWSFGGGAGKVTDGWGCVYADGVTLFYLRKQLEEQGGGEGACPGPAKRAPAAAPKPPKPKKEWVPGRDTAGRALLVGLYRKKYGIGCKALGDEGVGKDELANFSEKWCTVSILRPAGGAAGARTFDRGAEHVNWYTGWSTVTTYMEPRGLVDVKGHPKKFWSLTEKGEELALRMHLEQVAIDTGQPIPEHNPASAAPAAGAPSSPSSLSHPLSSVGHQPPSARSSAGPSTPPRDPPPKPPRPISLSYDSDSDQEQEHPQAFVPSQACPPFPSHASPRSGGGGVVVIEESPVKSVKGNKVAAREDARQRRHPESCHYGSGCFRDIYSHKGAAHFAQFAHPRDHPYGSLLDAEGLLCEQHLQQHQQQGKQGSAPRCHPEWADGGVGEMDEGVVIDADGVMDDDEALARILQREEQRAVGEGGGKGHSDRGSGGGRAQGGGGPCSVYERGAAYLGGLFKGESSLDVAHSMGSMMRDINRGDAGLHDSAAEPGSSKSCVARGAGAEGRNWKVTLIVDSSEPKDLIAMLSAWGVPCEQRGLHGGDFVWIATDQGCEVVLDYILERKRVDDYVSSMVGKRYVSQKYRMTECGIVNKIYLVEGDPRAANLKQLPQGCDDHEAGHKTWEDRIRSATIETEVFQKFVSVKTDDLKGTAMLLWRLTTQIEGLVREHGVGPGSALMANGSVVSYASFQDKMKHLKHDMTLNDMHQIMLSTIKGLGAKSAEVMSQEFATPSDFFDAVSKCSSLAEFGAMITAVCNKHKSRAVSKEAIEQLWSAWSG